MKTCLKCGSVEDDSYAFCGACGTRLPDIATLVVDGPAEPEARHPDKPTGPGVRAAPTAPERAVVLTSSHAFPSVQPGDETGMTLRVRNVGRVVDEVTLEIRGAAAAWTEISPRRLNLMPGTEQVAQVLFKPPRRSDVPSGSIPFLISATSREEPSRGAEAEGELTVGVFREATVDLAPRSSSGRSGAQYAVRLHNRGNATLQTVVRPSDPDLLLEFNVARDRITVPPGGGAEATITVRAKRTFWFGSSEQHPFDVAVDLDDAPQLHVTGSFVQLPRLPRWVIPAAGIVLAATLALGAAALGVFPRPTPAPTSTPGPVASISASALPPEPSTEPSSDVPVAKTCAKRQPPAVIVSSAGDFVLERGQPDQPVRVYGRRSPDSANQLWCFDGTFFQSWADIGLVLDIQNGVTDPGQPIIVHEKRPDQVLANQQWRLDGGYIASLLADDLVIDLDLSVGAAADGRPIQSNHRNGGPNQMWSIIPVTSPP